jgi:hypothetical protein
MVNSINHIARFHSYYADPTLGMSYIWPKTKT